MKNSSQNNKKSMILIKRSHISTDYRLSLLRSRKASETANWILILTQFFSSPLFFKEKRWLKSQFIKVTEENYRPSLLIHPLHIKWKTLSKITNYLWYIFIDLISLPTTCFPNSGLEKPRKQLIRYKIALNFFQVLSFLKNCADWKLSLQKSHRKTIGPQYCIIHFI